VAQRKLKLVNEPFLCKNSFIAWQVTNKVLESTLLRRSPPGLLAFERVHDFICSDWKSVRRIRRHIYLTGGSWWHEQPSSCCGCPRSDLCQPRCRTRQDQDRVRSSDSINIVCKRVPSTLNAIHLDDLSMRACLRRCYGWSKWLDANANAPILEVASLPQTFRIQSTPTIKSIDTMPVEQRHLEEHVFQIPLR
jgi:hypothetical protein